MQRLVSKPEDGGGTRQEWLDCIRELVKVRGRLHSTIRLLVTHSIRLSLVIGQLELLKNIDNE